MGKPCLVHPSTYSGGPVCGLRPAFLIAQCPAWRDSQREIGCAICCGRGTENMWHREIPSIHVDLRGGGEGSAERGRRGRTLNEDLFDGFWPDFSATAVFEKFAVFALGSDAGGVLFPKRCHGVRRDLRRYISIIGQRFESRSEMDPDWASLSHCIGDGSFKVPH